MHSAYESLESSPLCGNDKCLQDQVSMLLVELASLDARVREAHVFSPNEEIEDIKTQDIKLLMVPYLLGELTMKVMESR